MQNLKFPITRALLLREATKIMFWKTVTFIFVFYIFTKIQFTKPNDAGAVSFDRLELQIKKNSKFIYINNIEYDKFVLNQVPTFRNRYL